MIVNIIVSVIAIIGWTGLVGWATTKAENAEDAKTFRLTKC